MGSDTTEFRIHDEGRVRSLVSGAEAVHSVMLLDNPQELVLPYMQYMLAGLLFVDAPASALSLGLGGGAQLRYLRDRFPGMALTGVEADARVMRLARDKFGLNELAGDVQLETEDAREYLRRADGRYDLVLVDIHDGREIPDWVFSEVFLRDCRRCQGAGGFVAFNLLPADEQAFRTGLMNVRRVFDQATLCLALQDYRNIVVLAFAQPPAPVSALDLQALAVNLERELGLPFSTMAGNLLATNPPGNGLISGI